MITKNSFNSTSWTAKIVFLFSGLYVFIAIGYLWDIIPATFRADYLSHLMRYVRWDADGDYWRFIPFIFEFQSGHIIALQKITAIANFYLFGHSATFSKFIGLGVMFFCWILYVSLTIKIYSYGLRTALFSLLVALLIFSVHSYEVISWTDSIPAHYPAACFAALGFYYFGAYSKGQSRYFLGWTILWGGAAVLTSGSGWAYLPAIFLLLILREFDDTSEISAKKIWINIKYNLRQYIIGLVILGITGYWVLSHANAGNINDALVDLERVFTDPIALFIHWMAVIAAPITQFPIARVWPYGLLITVIAITAIIRLPRKPHIAYSLWSGLILFGLFSCLMIAFSRYAREVYGLGVVSSRYTIYAIPIYIGIAGAFIFTEKTQLLRSPIARHSIKVFVMFSIILFIISTVWLQKIMINQNLEVAQMTKLVSQWNMKAMLRISSDSVMLPRLYLETLPELVRTGKANVLTNDFIPAGKWSKEIEPIRAMLEKGEFNRANHTSSCSAPDGKITATIDNRYQYEIRPVYGTSFIRFTGYLRDTKNCDAPLKYLVALSHGNQIMCVSKSGAYVWDDMPDNLREPHNLMSSQYAFDFSCPVLSKNTNVFPVKLLGYSPANGTLQLLE